jgi:cytosine/uracil/thiamine/allantoin permease
MESIKSLVAILGLLLIILLIALGPWVCKSYFEAAAFNRATGKNVSTWDAMWIELRVEGEGK